MGPLAAWAAILAGALTSASIVTAGGFFILRALWKIKGSWDQTNLGLLALVKEVAGLVASEETEHRRLAERDAEIAGRLERHLEWHDRH